MRLFPLLLAAAFAVSTTAHANVISETVTGTISSGVDTYGLWGTGNTGVDFTGNAISLTFSYDPALGTTARSRGEALRFASAGAVSVTASFGGVTASQSSVVGGTSSVAATPLPRLAGGLPSAVQAISGTVLAADGSGQDFTLGLTSTFATGVLDSQAALDSALQLFGGAGAQTFDVYDASGNTDTFAFTTTASAVAVPEPGTLLLLAGFSAATYAVRRRRA